MWGSNFPRRCHLSVSWPQTSLRQEEHFKELSTTRKFLCLQLARTTRKFSELAIRVGLSATYSVPTRQTLAQISSGRLRSYTAAIFGLVMTTGIGVISRTTLTRIGRARFGISGLNTGENSRTRCFTTPTEPEKTAFRTNPVSIPSSRTDCLTEQS